MKYFAVCILGGLAVFVGYIFSKKYSKRAKFFQTLVAICHKFEIEICYSRERLKNLFLSLEDKQKNSLFGIDKNFCDFLENKVSLEKETLFNGINFLKENEKDVIFLFFKSLGRSDVQSQSKEIKQFQKSFEEFSSLAVNENKKYGTLSIKMGIVCALLIAVLIL